MVKKIALVPKLDTSAEPQLRRTLVKAQGSDIVIDGSSVEMIGARCVETLLSAASIWSASDLGFTIVNASPQMTEDLGRFGLAPNSLLECAI